MLPLVQAVGDHQLDAVLSRHLDHPLAVIRSDCHRLLAEHMQTRACGALRVLAVHRIRQGDVHGVHVTTLEQSVGVGIAADPADSIAPRELSQLLRVEPSACCSAAPARKPAESRPARCGRGRPRHSGPSWPLRRSRSRGVQALRRGFSEEQRSRHRLHWRRPEGSGTVRSALSGLRFGARRLPSAAAFRVGARRGVSVRVAMRAAKQVRCRRGRRPHLTGTEGMGAECGPESKT